MAFHIAELGDAPPQGDGEFILSQMHRTQPRKYLDGFLGPRPMPEPRCGTEVQRRVEWCCLKICEILNRYYQYDLDMGRADSGVASNFHFLRTAASVINDGRLPTQFIATLARQPNGGADLMRPPAANARLYGAAELRAAHEGHVAQYKQLWHMLVRSMLAINNPAVVQPASID